MTNEVWDFGHGGGFFLFGFASQVGYGDADFADYAD